MVYEREIEATTTPGPTERHRRMSTISNPSESILLDFVDTVNSHLSEIVDTDDFRCVIHSTKHLCDTIYKLLARVSTTNAIDDQMTSKCTMLKQKLDMLLETLKEENAHSNTSDDLTKTLNEISGMSESNHLIAAAVATINNSPTKMDQTRRASIAKTDKDKYNTKERRNSRYFVRNGDKEEIQLRANSLKRALSTVVEASGIYDHKSRSRKHSLVALNIPANIESAANSSPVSPPPINIISPSSSITHLTLSDVDTILLSYPEQRRSSMDETFLHSINLPVPKQFADASSRRSSGIPEAIQEEEGNGLHADEDVKIEKNEQMEYNYDVGYLNLTHENGDTESCVPIEVYERNRLRSSYQSTVEFSSAQSSMGALTQNVESNTLQVPTLSLCDVEFMERSPPTAMNAIGNVYVSDSMTIIDTDAVSSIETRYFLGIFFFLTFAVLSISGTIGIC